MTIENEEQLRLAVDEVQELSGAIEGSPEEDRLIEIADAIAAWNALHAL